MPQVRSYIWQKAGWPNFRWDGNVLLPLLGECRYRQGALMARLRELGLEARQQTQAAVMTREALQTAAIEGERLDPESVRSSVARRLGLPTAGLTRQADARAAGLVDVLLDATHRFDLALTGQRLWGWHAGLFPTGYSGIHPIRPGRWREDTNGPMRVVSGPLGHERVHYEAPPASRVAVEMDLFLKWWHLSRGRDDGLLRAAAAHQWFVAIHPFEDGNGRIARALVDMALSQDANSPTRFYSLSSQIMADRDAYYDVLETTNSGDLDITVWIGWFLKCLGQALDRSSRLLDNVAVKARFWQRHAHIELTARQKKALNRLLEAGPGGFEGGLTNRKFASLAHTSRATAQRELAELVKKGLLRRNPGGGRSISYDLVWEPVGQD